MNRGNFLKSLGFGFATAATAPVLANIPVKQKEVDWDKKEWKDWIKKHLTDRGTTYVRRNEKGNEYEKSGKIDLAIKEYEASVKDQAWGSNPYKRLFIIYKKQGNYIDARRVAEKWLALADEYKTIIPNKDFKPFEKTKYYETYQYFVKSLNKL